MAFRQADIFNLLLRSRILRPCVRLLQVLETPTARPAEALRALKDSIKNSGGTITVIEGDHGSTYFHPDSAYARRAVDCLVQLQARAGGDALIGRTLYPLLRQAGFDQVQVSPRMVYVDSSKPALVEGFTKKTFTAMIEGVRAPALRVRPDEPRPTSTAASPTYTGPPKPTALFATPRFKARGFKTGIARVAFQIVKERASTRSPTLFQLAQVAQVSKLLKSSEQLDLPLPACHTQPLVPAALFQSASRGAAPHTYFMLLKLVKLTNL